MTKHFWNIFIPWQADKHSIYQLNLTITTLEKAIHRQRTFKFTMFLKKQIILKHNNG